MGSSPSRPLLLFCIVRKTFMNWGYQDSHSLRARENARQCPSPGAECPQTPGPPWQVAAVPSCCCAVGLTRKTTGPGGGVFHAPTRSETGGSGLAGDVLGLRTSCLPRGNLLTCFGAYSYTPDDCLVPGWPLLNHSLRARHEIVLESVRFIYKSVRVNTPG